jgi:hypothetical protein
MMDYRKRPASAETEADSAQRGPEQTMEQLVNVRLTLLEDLKDLQEHLEAFIKCYIASREVYELCEKVEARLALGTRESIRLADKIYWEDIRDWLDDGYEKIALGLAPMIREEYKDNVSGYEANLKTIQDAMMGPIRDPHGVALVETANDGLRTIEDMKNDIKPIIAKSRRHADEVLDQIGKVIHRIFERIEFTREQSIGEASHKRASHESKLREEPTRHGKEPSVQGEGPAPSAAARGGADKRGR